MSQEALSRVLEAEARAEAIREQAAVDARARVDACEKACIRIRDEALAAEARALREREATVRARAEALIAQSREEAVADIESLRDESTDKMREAIKHIEWELCDI